MIAQVQDVQDRFFREFTDEERTLVESRLKDAENKIRIKIPDLDQKILENPLLEHVVVTVCCDAVIRLVRNPEGYIQETDGNYTYMLSQESASGRLTILPEEWADLGIRRKVGVMHIAPKFPSELNQIESIR